MRWNRLRWMVKQLVPLMYVSHYGTHEGAEVAVWRMWFGRCFAVRVWRVTETLYPRPA